jgi:hypothetical protein
MEELMVEKKSLSEIIRRAIEIESMHELGCHKKQVALFDFTSGVESVGLSSTNFSSDPPGRSAPVPDEIRQQLIDRNLEGHEIVLFEEREMLICGLCLLNNEARPGLTIKKDDKFLYLNLVPADLIEFDQKPLAIHEDWHKPE